jgi:hypothetical protein
VTSRLVGEACHAVLVTLLSQLVNAAADDAVPVATLLLKLKVIAVRTDADPLAAWVRHEMDGYPDGVDLPTYRGPFEMQVLGHFVGPFGFEARNYLIPPSTFPKEQRLGPLFSCFIANPVAEVETFAAKDDPQLPWPADAVRYYNAAVARGVVQPLFRDGVGLVEATRPISPAVFVGLLAGVRSRILDLALALEKAAPGAGQPDAPAETKAEAARVVNVHFHASATNVAIDSTTVAQSVTVTAPAAGDEEGLLRYLGAVGVHPDQVVQLQQALAEDKADNGGVHPARPGGRVAAWVAQASTDMGTNAAGSLLAAGLEPLIAHALKAFFG